MARDVVCTHSDKRDTAEALRDLKAGLVGAEPIALFFFCSANHDGLQIERELKALAPLAEVIGCTTSGEFTDRAYTSGGVSVLALSHAKVLRCAAALAEYDKGSDVEASVHAATRRIAQKLQVDLREVDPERWVGVVLHEGLKGNEEEANAVLGHVSPFLSFLGGSAGDNVRLKETLVFYDGQASTCGSVMMLMELAVPYVIVKTCSFEPTSTKLRIGRVQGRVVYEIDGQPAVPTYAAKIGVPPEALGPPVFMANPLGLMIDGEPWVRSPIAILPDGGLLFGCKIIEGAELNLLKSTDLVGDTKDALDKGAAKLGGKPSVGLLFNCAHRCIEIQMKHLEAPFCEAIADFPVAGFHSYGESWLAHMNQMLIALLLG
jgi:hypothetical protein